MSQLTSLGSVAVLFVLALSSAALVMGAAPAPAPAPTTPVPVAPPVAPAAPTLKVGDVAPAFSLPNQDDKATTLADSKGKWVVLYFYPKDFTTGCTTEACEFRDGIESLKGVNAVVLGVSADDAKSHRDFIAQYKLPFTLLVDAKKEVLAKYRTDSTSNRVTVVIDPDGKVAFMWPKVNPTGHAKAVTDKLTELKKAREAATH